jgi:hypothetical protein
MGEVSVQVVMEYCVDVKKDSGELGTSGLCL